MGMAGLSAPTSGTTALSGGALSSPMGMISPGAANSGTSLFGGASGGAGLTGTSSISGSPNSGSLLQNLSPQMSSSSPTGGTVLSGISGSNGFLGAGGVNPAGTQTAQSLSPTMSAASGTPATSLQGAAAGFLGTGGTNPAGTQAAQSVAPSLSGSTGTSSNGGGDSNGTMNTLPSTNTAYSNGTTPGAVSVPTIGQPTGYNLSAGVNTSPTSLLPGGAVSPTNLGVQQQVNAPSAQSVVAQNPLTGPTNWNVTPNQTLSGQYAALMKTGNPAIQAAEQQVIQANALHGGNNDLMAQTAATMQGSQLALQIGAADASTYASAAQYNASAANAYASQLNQFTANAALSSQNFQQGVAMLNAQTNQQFQLMAGQINAGAYTTSMNLNANLAATQTSINATMQTMDKQFTQNLALMGAQSSIASQQAYQQYGMNVQLGYLSSISQQQAMLMQTIGQIQSNPNITATQAQGAMENAINEFNTFVTQMGAYASAMMPAGSSFPSSVTSGSSTTPYTSATYPMNGASLSGTTGSKSSAASITANEPTATSIIDPATWPSMSTSVGGPAANDSTFTAPQAVSSGSIIPSYIQKARTSPSQSSVLNA